MNEKEIILREIAVIDEALAIVCDRMDTDDRISDALLREVIECTEKIKENRSPLACHRSHTSRRLVALLHESWFPPPIVSSFAGSSTGTISNRRRPLS